MENLNKCLAIDYLQLIANVHLFLFFVGVLKLNLEPKKSSSTVSGGKNRSSNKSSKVENPISTPSGSSVDIESSSRTPIGLTSSHSSEVQGNNRPTTLSLPGCGEKGEKNSLTPSETDASPTRSQNLDAASTPIPRISTGKTREDTLQPQSTVVNGNPQPLR